MSTKSLPKAVTHIELSGRSTFGGAERLALGCVYDDARYHVWVDPKTTDVGDKLYKNPLVEQGAPGHFNTRTMKPTSQFGAGLIYAMLKAYREEDLLKKYQDREVEKAREARSQREKDLFRERLEEFAPRLFDTVVETQKEFASSKLYADLAIKLTDLIREIDPEGKVVRV